MPTCVYVFNMRKGDYGGRGTFMNLSPIPMQFNADQIAKLIMLFWFLALLLHMIPNSFVSIIAIITRIASCILF